MSPLTKLFVVLLVVLSMLNAAAEVVYVNSMKPLQSSLAASAQAAATANAQASADRIALERAEGALAQEIQQHASDHKADVGTIAHEQQQINETNIQLASKESEKIARDSTINQLTSNLLLQTTTAAALSKQVTDLRAINDTLVKREEDSQRTLADLSNTRDTLQAQLNHTQEMLVALQAQIAGGVAPGGNANVNANPGGGVGSIHDGPVIPPANNIAGSVVEKQVINGNTYLRISVGKNDGVVKGTVFHVLHAGNFVGDLTIDETDDHDAMGKLIGDATKIGLVGNGDPVKTQLRG